MKKKNNQPQRYLASVAGDFYAECLRDGECNNCFLPQLEAPNIVGYAGEHPQNGQCYFKRQPESPEELQRACEAVEMACCEGLRYGGRDETVIAALKGFNCDYV